MLKIKIGKFLIGRVKGRFAALTDEVILLGKEATEEFADHLVERVKDYISIGGMPTKPLSKYTKKHKRNKANKDKILIDTGQYLDSIQKIKTYEIRNAVMYEVAPGDEMHRETYENLRDIGWKLEFGDPYNVFESDKTGEYHPIPPRPHFEPAYEDTLQEKGDAYDKFMKDICKRGIL